ncbi:OmpA family protein [Streptomyces hokutonensis]|uniref:OmpA family protein n=1 Tax=Streptomyces hokutonensis TaxID=1306990 RepID=UPI003F54136B
MVLLARDSSRLTSSARSRLAAIAAEIKQQAVTRVRVFGFTDNLGSSAHGDILSQQRADAVQAVLADTLPSTVTFEARGFGERRPVASNTTEAGRRESLARRDLVPAYGGITRTIVHVLADLLATPRDERQFRSLLLTGGFDDVTVEVRTRVFTDPTMPSLLASLAERACTSGAVDRDQADTWLAEQRRRAETSRFLVAIPFFVASASAYALPDHVHRKPSENLSMPRHASGRNSTSPLRAGAPRAAGTPTDNRAVLVEDRVHDLPRRVLPLVPSDRRMPGPPCRDHGFDELPLPVVESARAACACHNPANPEDLTGNDAPPSHHRARPTEHHIPQARTAL